MKNGNACVPPASKAASMNDIRYPFGRITLLAETPPRIRVECQSRLWWESPLYPTDHDSRVSPAGLNQSGQYAFHLLLPGGKIGLDLHPTLCQTDGDQLHIRLEDPRWKGLSVDLRLQLWEEGIFTQDVTISNNLDAPVLLLRASSLSFQLDEPAYYATFFRGSWAGENVMEEHPVPKGQTLSVHSYTGIKTAQEGTPGLLLSTPEPAREERGFCLLGALCWSGNYEISLTHNAYGVLFAHMGCDFSNAPYALAPGQQLDLPRAVIAASHTGKGDASRRLHRFVRNHILPHGNEIRRTLLNSWEGVHFNVEEPTLHRMMECASELGIELFVLDDGWFGNRVDDTSSLGDWETDLTRIPHGLAGLADQANRCGMGFGLWIEPEMVSPESELFRRNPDWAIRTTELLPAEERRQLVLNLTLPEVEHFVLSTVSGLLRQHPGISYVKWDCNRKITDAEDPHLYVDYIAAYYRIMQTLRERFPDVTFQCCSAGGGRLDLGAARFHEEFWLSDNTDAYERLRMQWSASHFFPANAIGAHVTVSPNLYSHRSTSLKFRFDVALSGRLGFELDPRRLSHKEAEELKQRLQMARQCRPLIQQGDLYRLLSPYEGPDCALMYLSEKKALVLAYTTERPFVDQHMRLRLQGLDPHERYRLRELEPNEEGFHCPQRDTIMTGQELMERGLILQWNAPMQSSIILLQPEGMDRHGEGLIA